MAQRAAARRDWQAERRREAVEAIGCAARCGVIPRWEVAVDEDYQVPRLRRRRSKA